MNIKKIGTRYGIPAGALIFGLIIGSATSGHSTTVTSPQPTVTVTDPAVTVTATPDASPSSTSASAGAVGGSFQVTDENNNVYDVTLTKIIDPAQGADQFNTPANGTRFVAAVFHLKGVSGTASDDANNDATIIGSNDQTYTEAIDTIVGYTNFDSGEFNLQAGDPSTGAVVFQVPNGVSVAKVEWTASSGFGSSAEWDN